MPSAAPHPPDYQPSQLNQLIRKTGCRHNSQHAAPTPAILTRTKNDYAHRLLGIPSSRAFVDTIAGWCMRYAHAFPGIANPPDGMPQSSDEWDQLYHGAIRALGIGAIREVVAASY